ncbi:hypothetical protein DLAC_11781 [Tieghemostelium lacteum]|uniref:Transmembrane protein n=1 Tax=Tieghemostelium lacteum TaxID=361077 RepID=A0A151Z780_TIELA|nr:hypothetical protein DLAC_11781 [Tieghemostelium lacteum]|eukprot:KYQ89644.1 hypothetical protein DLAC_11781 [Tieghemostelium lacteum]
MLSHIYKIQRSSKFIGILNKTYSISSIYTTHNNNQRFFSTNNNKYNNNEKKELEDRYHKSFDDIIKSIGQNTKKIEKESEEEMKIIKQDIEKNKITFFQHLKKSHGTLSLICLVIVILLYNFKTYFHIKKHKATLVQVDHHTKVTNNEIDSLNKELHNLQSLSPSQQDQLVKILVRDLNRENGKLTASEITNLKQKLF